MIEKRLARWVAAGLLDADQAERIAAFERERGKPVFLYAVAGLGGLAIAIGLVSIVASNWDAIPGRLKLAIDLVMVGGLGYGVSRWDRSGPGWAREAGILVLYGLVVASIALIGQVYQLGGKAHEALAVWSALTALLMTRGRSSGLAFVWLAGLQITYATWLVWIGEGPWDLEEWAVCGVYWAPLLTMAAGRSARINDLRPAFATISRSVAWTELVLCASAGTFAFYSEVDPPDAGVLWGGLAISSVLTGWLWTRLPSTAGGRAERWLLVLCLAMSHLPVLLSPGDLDVVGALTFIGLWVAVAFWAHRNGTVRTLNLATAVIGVRILVVYFEVFGSLLGTGVGLVSGGLLTLALVWLWVRKKREFGEELDPGSAQELDAESGQDPTGSPEGEVAP